MSWLIVISLLAATSGDVTVQTIDGATVQGRIAVWDQSGIELTTDNASPQRISRKELVEIDFGVTESSNMTPAMELLLSDGSVIPAEDGEIESSEVHISGRVGPKNGEYHWKLPSERLRAIRFDRATPNQDDAWRQITQRARTSDLLVLYKKSRNTLDEVEGVIQQVTSAAVLFDLDGEPIEIPRERVFGLVFYRRNGEQQSQSGARVKGLHGLELVASDVRLEPDRLDVELLGGGTLKVPLPLVSKLDFSTGAVVYLSDLEPELDAPNWQPVYKLPENVPLVAAWGKPRRNESFDGGKLKLEQRTEDGQLIIRKFDRGLAMRSRSEATFRLPAEYNSFRAIVGIDPASYSDSDALLLIEADGRTLGEWRLERKTDAQAIDLDITGKRQLRLIVDYGSGTDAGDIVHICDPRLIK